MERIESEEPSTTARLGQTLRRRGVLAAAVALAAGGLSHQTSRLVQAGTDGDLILGAVNNLVLGVNNRQTSLRAANGAFPDGEVLAVDGTGDTTGGTAGLAAFGGPGGTTFNASIGVAAVGGNGTAARPPGADGLLGKGGNGGDASGAGGSGVMAMGGAGGSPSGPGGAGLQAFGNKGGGQGAPGVGLQGTGGGTAPNQGSGVVGLTSSTLNPAVSGQNSAAGDGVFGNSSSGIGVHGTSSAQTAVYGNTLTGVGARGDSQLGPGVVGTSATNNGVLGLSPGAGNGVFGQSGNGNGVLGQATTAGGNGVQGLATTGSGIFGTATAGPGVFGTSGSGAGVMGSTANNNAVFGDASASGNGVFARSAHGNGLVAQATGNGNAATFFGNVIVNGNLTVMPGFAKSGAVSFADGSVRRLYATEAPESWFEDFGEAQLVNGRASVPIAADFAQAVNTSVPYHVFLTPHSEAIETLAATVRAPDHFEVRASGRGVVDGSFSYRLVAKRQGAAAPRFERVAGAEQRAPLASDAALRLPAAAEAPALPHLPDLPVNARQVPPVQPVPAPPAETRKPGR